MAEALQGKVLQLSLGTSVAAELPPVMAPAMGIYWGEWQSTWKPWNPLNETRGEKVALVANEDYASGKMFTIPEKSP